jgi:uncharacterized protein
MTVRQSGNSTRAALVAALVAVLGGGSLYALSRDANSPSQGESEHDGEAAAATTAELVTATGRHKITIEIADTPEKQALGLMYRTSLPDNRGMLFTHAPPREVTMWMRNTYIPLDMVFIRSDGTVHRIAANTQPMSDAVIASEGDVSAVLELAGGDSQRLGLAPGDKVEHPYFVAP